MSAFVSHPKIPQLADAEEVFAAIQRVPGVLYSALVPNERGLERALAPAPTRSSVFTAASETFNHEEHQRHHRRGLCPLRPGAGAGAARRHAHARLRLDRFWCPYEGASPPGRAGAVVLRLLDMGFEEVSIGDTIGKAAPDEVRALLDLLVLPRRRPRAARAALPRHLRPGRRQRSSPASQLGVHAFDASTGGIGGCPYAPGAPGNVATETLVRALARAGAEVSVNLTVLDQARRVVGGHLGERRRGVAAHPT